MRDLDPRTVNLRTLPLQIGRRTFILNAILIQNNFRHAIKDNGVSYDTMEDRSQYIQPAFHFLEHNDIKSFKLDPRSLGDRHVRFLFADMERRAKAGQLGPSTIQKAHSYLRTFAGWIGKPCLVLPIGAYISDETLYRRTGKLVGEGFDHPPLDTLVLAMPVSWKGTLQQYAGRLHREHASKADVRIIDFVDTGHPALLRMWDKRQRGYRAMGYRMGVEFNGGEDDLPDAPCDQGAVPGP